MLILMENVVDLYNSATVRFIGMHIFYLIFSQEKNTIQSMPHTKIKTDLHHNNTKIT